MAVGERFMNFSLIKEVVACVGKLEIQKMKRQEVELLDFLNNKSAGLFGDIFKASRDLERYFNMEENCIYECKWFFDSTITFFYHKKTDEVYAIGPARNEPFSEVKFADRLKSLSLPKEKQKELLYYGSIIPVVSEESTYRLSLIIMRKLLKIKGNISHQAITPVQEVKKYQEMENVLPTTSSMRSIEDRYEMSVAITEAVKEGNYSLAMTILGDSAKFEGVSKRSSSPLRNLQNYAIVINTQLRHSLEGQIHPYKLDKVSDQIGREIEELTSIGSGYEFFSEIIKRYCSLVRENAYPNLKPLAHLAVTYIKERLNQELSVKEVAKALTVNANYLSWFFKKEMKMSFTDFVNSQRIKQAKNLIRFTNMQIQQIAYLVGYNNTNYFVKNFYKFTSQTPTEYRRGQKGNKN